MSNFFDHFIGFFITICFVFILLGLVLFGTENNINSNIQKETAEFVNEICVSGRVSSREYMEYSKKIYTYGNYEIQLICDCYRAYPCKDENGEDAYRIGTNTYATNQIMEYMYPEPYRDNHGAFVYPPDRDFSLSAGDSVTVSVVRQHSLASGFHQAFFKNTNSGTVITSYNNVVGYTGSE